MADPQEGAAAATEPKSRGGLLLTLGLMLVSAGGGAAVPMWLNKSAGSEHGEPASEDHTDKTSESVFVPFGDVTVNLNEGRMNRYLRLKVALHVTKADEVAVTQAAAQQNLILRNWLISHLSDKLLDEIRGAAGQNMLRREIRNEFNTVMFSDGRERIVDVLFEEFNVQ